jgi:serine/threonine protein kinase
MAPEVKLGRHYDTKADVYSLGVISKDLFVFDILITANTHSSSIRFEILYRFLWSKVKRS